MNYSTSIIKEFICGAENTIGTITAHNGGAFPLSGAVKGSLRDRALGEPHLSFSLSSKFYVPERKLFVSLSAVEGRPGSSCVGVGHERASGAPVVGEHRPRTSPRRSKKVVSLTRTCGS